MVVKYQGRMISHHNSQAEAEQWVQSNYSTHGYEIERVVVRTNSPRGVKVGE